MVLVVQRNSEELLDFKEDLPTTLKADKIYWDQCINELEEAETQLENVRKLALHEAKANKVIYSLPNKKKQHEDNDSDELSVASISLEEEVGMLRSTKIGMFALSAIKKVSQLRERVDIAREKFRQLIEYFGEDQNSKMQPHELFEIISTFCRDFDVAREDVIKLEKAKVSFSCCPVPTQDESVQTLNMIHYAFWFRNAMKRRKKHHTVTSPKTQSRSSVLKPHPIYLEYQCKKVPRSVHHPANLI